MHPLRSDRRARARLADEYCQALRDAAIHPAFHYDVARARVADVYHQVQRDALAHVTSRGHRR